jgi:hypothetical protein
MSEFTKGQRVRFHGEVDDDHAPCRWPGEPAMEYTDRMLGYARDV